MHVGMGCEDRPCFRVLVQTIVYQIACFLCSPYRRLILQSRVYYLKQLSLVIKFRPDPKSTKLYSLLSRVLSTDLLHVNNSRMITPKLYTLLPVVRRPVIPYQGVTKPQVYIGYQPFVHYFNLGTHSTHVNYQLSYEMMSNLVNQQH